MCATHPEKPDVPSTTVVTDYVIFNWDAPVDNGTPITGYEVYIRQSDLTFILDRTICDGLDFTVIQNTQCIVQLDDLSAEPYNLLLGVSIQIRVKALNAYGESQTSEIGNQATMVFVPDAPISLQNDPTTTSDSVVRFTWTEGPSNGDRTVIDYRVIYDQSTEDFVTLAEGVLTTYYETSISLIKGQIYTFKVQARNTVGYSVESNELGVLVAQVPDKPEAPTTTIDGDTVRIDWIIPYDGSSPITGYIIIVQHNDGVTYTEETTHCNGLEIAIIDNHSCNVLISDLIQAPYHRDWGASIYAKVIAINIIGNS